MKKILFCLAFLWIVIQCHAQTENFKSARLEFPNGDVVTGKVISITDDEITILNAYGDELKFSKKEIEEIIFLDSEEDDYSHFFLDQYFLLSSNFPIEKGKSYYKNQNIFINQFNFGISKNFSLGLGFESASLLIGGEFPPIFYINPRIHGGGENIRFGLNYLGIVIPFDGGSFINSIFPSVTFGAIDRNISIGGGILLDDDVIFPMFTLSALSKIGKKSFFIAENYLFTYDSDNLILSNLGFRFQLSRNAALDASLLISLQEGAFPIPLLGLSIRL